MPATPLPQAHAGQRRIALLGTPRWSVPGGPEQVLAARDALLLLLLATEGAVERSRAAALLWPDSAPRQANISLRQRIFRLKRALGVDVVAGDTAIRLADALEHDVHDPQAGLRADPCHAAGELLAGVDADDAESNLARWLRATRERWHERLQQTLAALAEEHQACGRIAAALPYAERLVAEAPVAEHAHRRLMRMHYLRGDRAAALAAYRRCRELLSREVGVAPGAETQALAAQIEAGAPAAAPAAPLPLALLRPPRLVGREAALADIVRGLEAALPVRVQGEPGIGKSRLLADFVATRPGWILVDARPGDAAVAYSLLAALLPALAARFGAPATPWAAAELARLAPTLGAAAADPFSALRLRQALRHALDDWRGAGLAGIALDDLQFADPASIDLLLPLAAAGGARWLVAHRPWPQRPVALDEWVAVLLAPLDASQVALLVETLALPGWEAAGWVDALARRTGGNPLFVLRAIGSWLAAGAVPSGLDAPALPGDLTALVEQRLGQVSALARGLARAAAVAAESFDIELAARLLGRRPLELADAVQELRAAQLMDGARFAHDLVREAALRSTPPEIALLLQRDVAHALAARHFAPARVAAHWEAAHCWDEAAASYADAAARAAAASALHEQRTALEGRARCLRATATASNLRAAFDADACRCRLLIRSLDTDAATTLLAALQEQAADEAQRATALELLAHLRLERQDAAGALEAAQQAGKMAVTARLRRVELLAAQRTAIALMRLGRANEAVVSLEAEADALEPLDGDEQLHWLSDLALALDGADRRRRAIGVLERVATLAAAQERGAVEAEAWSQLGVTLMYAGRLDDSTAAYRRSIALARRAGLGEASVLVDQMGLIGNLRDRGLYDEYLAQAQAMPDALRCAGLDFWAANAENDLATTYAMLGRADLALRTLAALPPDRPALMRGLRLLVRCNLARYYGVGAPASGALAQWAAQAVELIGEHGGRGYLRLRLALETAADLPPDEGVARVRAVQGEADRREMPMLAAAAGLQLIRLLLKSGKAADAAAVAHDVLARDAADGPQAGVFRPAFGWLVHQALRIADPPRAQEVLADTAAWVMSAADHHVPPLFRESFLQRQPINAALLAAARRSRV
jgi:DNA-binding SARP family transcriptional activator